jgi:carbon monoxide dehydrogenase subunit G
MELASQQALPIAPAHAWEALNDIELLRRAIPGCESITASGENAYELLVAAAIGPVKAKFKGKLQLLDIMPPESYTMRFDGQGGAAGFGKGSAKVRLAPAEDGSTILHYSVDAQVGGKIAQIGSRLVEMAAQKMAQEFFANFRTVVLEKYPEAVTAPAASVETTPPAPGLLARLMAALRALFGRR